MTPRITVRARRGTHDNVICAVKPSRASAGADRSQLAGATVRRMTVFFIPLGRTKSKPQRSYMARVPL